MQPMGRMLVVLGIVIAGVGVGLNFFDKIPFLGKLPGDINIKRENFQLFFPITSSAIISIFITTVLWLFSYLKGK
jgi:quinol-cytochrome oxidoreductase complex cytochrome b subunit